MKRDKQTEVLEMARETIKRCRIDNQCGSCHWETCNECLAEVLYNAGYRKTANIVEEIFAEIESALNLSKCYGDSGIYFEQDLETDIAELKKKYERGRSENGSSKKDSIE